jgi:hypothetical protein
VPFILERVEGERAMPKLVISSEDDLFSALDRLLAEPAGELKEEGWEVSFDGWPRLEITLQGEDFDGGIPTRIMPALLDMQRKVDEAYLRLTEGEVRRLKKEERRRTELVVRVKSGSSIFSSELAPVLNAIAQAVGKMNGTETLIGILSVAAITGGVFAFKYYLNGRQSEKELDIKLAMSAEETRRLQVVERAIEQSNEIVREQSEAQAKAFDNLLNRLDSTDTIVADGQPLIDGETGKKLARAPRRETIESRLDGDFMILSVDSGGVRGGFKLHVRKLDDDLLLTVNVPQGTLAEAQIATLQEGEWGKRALTLRLNTRKRGDVIVDATLVEAGLANPG